MQRARCEQIPEYFTDEDKEWARLGRERQERVRKEYGTFFTEIARILYEHDFLGLATAGCPEDEYELEAGTIIPRLHETNTRDELARIIKEKFTRWYSLKSLGPDEWFAEVAQDIWATWQHIPRSNTGQSHLNPSRRRFVAQANHRPTTRISRSLSATLGSRNRRFGEQTKPRHTGSPALAVKPWPNNRYTPSHRFFPREGVHYALDCLVSAVPRTAP